MQALTPEFFCFAEEFRCNFRVILRASWQLAVAA